MRNAVTISLLTSSWDVEKIGHPAIVAICPNVIPGCGLDELRGYAKPVPRLPHTPLKNKRHSQFPSDDSDIPCFILVYKTGIARCYE